jgi:hypothetical protein
MASSNSDEDTDPLDTHPCGLGRCCAGSFCLNPNRSFYRDFVCSGCMGNPHEQGCFEFEDSVYTRFDLGRLFCLKCRHNNLEEERKRINREKRAMKKEAKEIFKKKTPFTIAANLAKFKMNKK